MKHVRKYHDKMEKQAAAKYPNRQIGLQEILKGQFIPAHEKATKLSNDLESF